MRGGAREVDNIVLEAGQGCRVDISAHACDDIVEETAELLAERLPCDPPKATVQHNTHWLVSKMVHFRPVASYVTT